MLCPDEHRCISILYQSSVHLPCPPLLRHRHRGQESERYFHELVAKSRFDPTLRPNTVTYAALISGGGEVAAPQHEERGSPPQIAKHKSAAEKCGAALSAPWTPSCPASPRPRPAPPACCCWPLPRRCCSLREGRPAGQGTGHVPAAAGRGGAPRPHHLLGPHLRLRARRWVGGVQLCGSVCEGGGACVCVWGGGGHPPP